MTRKSKLGLAAAGIGGASLLGWYLYEQAKPKEAPPIPTSEGLLVNQQYIIDYQARLAPAMGLRGLEKPVRGPIYDHVPGLKV